MKKLLLSIIVITAFYITNAQNVNIPDANFKAYLVGDNAINTNGDSEIQVSEATAFTGGIFANLLNIADLTGIEAFTALTFLDCGNNSLISLNLSSNTALTYLRLSYNNLTSLDLSANMDLDQLFCFYNSLTSLDLSANTVLTILNCSNNSLTSLDLSVNTALTRLNCNNNQLTSLDLSANMALTHLRCQDNQLTSLNLSNGNNTNMSNANFNATNNPNLTCIEVDDATWSTVNWFNIDTASSFSTNCSACIVTIPDANFKNYLVNNTAINTNGDTEIQCSEATAFTGAINVSNLSIANLTGVEAFAALTELYCDNNSLTSLDVSANTALTTLYCQYNYTLTSLDVSANTALTYLYCYNNSLPSLDVSSNTFLISLLCYNNQLTSLDLSANMALTSLWCYNNQLTSLDLSANMVLTQLRCQYNSLTSLNLANGNNTNMSNGNFIATSNPNLTCIEVDDATWSTDNWTNIDTASSFSTDCSLSVTNWDLENTFSIYPNPSKNVFKIESDLQISEIFLFDSLGKLIVKFNEQEEYNISNLTNGIYFMIIKSDDKIYLQKLMVN